MSSDSFPFLGRPVELYRNPFWRPDRPFRAIADHLRLEEMDRAAEVIRGWPEYEPTPLRSLSGLADRLGVGRCCARRGSRWEGGHQGAGRTYGFRLLRSARCLGPHRERAPPASGWPRLGPRPPKGVPVPDLRWPRCRRGPVARIRGRGASSVVDALPTIVLEAERRAARTHRCWWSPIPTPRTSPSAAP
jgi:hypothetical protein